jgi:hypothetical protein
LLKQSNAAPAELKAQFQKALALARDANERKLVISALAGVQHEFALQMMSPLLDDPAVRAEAVQAAMTLARRLHQAFPEATRALLQKLSGLPIEPSVKQSATELLKAIGQVQ